MKSRIGVVLLLAVTLGVLAEPSPAVAEDSSEPYVTEAELTEWLTLLQEPHLPGDLGHTKLIDTIERMAKEIKPVDGSIAVKRQDHPFTRWHSDGVSIDDWRSSHPCEGPIWELPYAGLTGPDGVTGKLIFAGTTRCIFPSSLKSKKYAGKIVVLKIKPFPMKPVLRALTRNAISSGSYLGPGSYRRALSLELQVPSLKDAKKAGVLGLIVIADADPEIVNHQYLPFTRGIQDLPAVYVDRMLGAKLIEMAKHQGSVTLRTEGSLTPNTSAPQLVVTLPATRNCRIGDQAIVVDTHTDGPNMFEENGVIALWALLKSFAKDACRPRDLVFVFAAAHFSKERGSTDSVLKDDPEMKDTTRAALAIEHLGALRSNADGADVGATEPAVVMITAHDKSLARIANEVMVAHAHAEPSLTPIHFLWSGVFEFGEGKFLADEKIPTIGYLTQPSYVLSRECGHETWFSRPLIRKQIDMFRDLISKMMKLESRQ